MLRILLKINFEFNAFLISLAKRNKEHKDAKKLKQIKSDLAILDAAVKNPKLYQDKKLYEREKYKARLKKYRKQLDAKNPLQEQISSIETTICYYECKHELTNIKNKFETIQLAQNQIELGVNFIVEHETHQTQLMHISNDINEIENKAKKMKDPFAKKSIINEIREVKIQHTEIQNYQKHLLRQKDSILKNNLDSSRKKFIRQLSSKHLEIEKQNEQHSKKAPRFHKPKWIRKNIINTVLFWRKKKVYLSQVEAAGTHRQRTESQPEIPVKYRAFRS